MSDNESTHYEAGTHPSWAPPATAVGVIGWMRQNLFSSWANSVLTLLGLYLVYTIFTPIIEWAFVNANWSGSSREA